MTPTVADDVERIGTILLAVSAVALVLSLGRKTDRWLQLLGALLASGLFLAHSLVARSVASGAWPANADVPVLEWMVGHRTPPLNRLFTEISAVGGTLGMAVLATGAAAALWLTHRRVAALGTIGAALGSVLLVEAFKNLYGRSRPPLAVQLVPESSLSFPSGHALESTVVVGMLAIVVGSCLRSRGLRALVSLLAVIAVGLIGLSRLYLGVHWLSDVLAGWLLGGAWLALCAVLVLPHCRDGTTPADPRPEVDDSAAGPPVPDDRRPGS